MNGLPGLTYSLTSIYLYASHTLPNLSLRIDTLPNLSPRIHTLPNLSPRIHTLPHSLSTYSNIPQHFFMCPYFTHTLLPFEHRDGMHIVQETHVK